MLDSALLEGRGRAQRSIRGKIGYVSGRMAEEAVADHYAQAGYALAASRWRGKAGEIDLILQKDGGYIFVEVKASADHQQAAERLSRRQMDRICHAACEYVGDLPTGSLTEMRFDAALVDNFGRIEVLENAFGLN
ncbi:YraN family protein [Paracoccus aminophilus]|uniref:Endonuclease n=1 Tax=Paracoccus aminophilus JCM 7686 TaxID=1367847 RepID=S5YVA1_PARAH|nr:YraN family protein [Paracoccus aminophilus]AGT09121.1 endonuclease [Paracoccus aminophilus JCM 7686]